jgi:hypothetical protein
VLYLYCIGFNSCNSDDELHHYHDWLQLNTRYSEESREGYFLKTKPGTVAFVMFEILGFSAAHLSITIFYMIVPWAIQNAENPCNN